MRLLFKQRFFSWFDSYDIYDDNGATVFTVEGREHGVHRGGQAGLGPLPLYSGRRWEPHRHGAAACADLPAEI